MKPHTVRRISATLIIVTIVVWIVWDIPAALMAGTYGTESAVIRDWATTHPAFGYAIGVLAGHWFWNVPEIKHPALMYVSISSIALFLFLDLVFQVFPPLYPLVSFGVGIVAGRLLWPLERAA